MTREEFRAAGAELFGYGWQTKMAREFRVAPRTVRTWACGETPVPGWVEVMLAVWPRAADGRGVLYAPAAAVHHERKKTSRAAKIP